MLVPETADELLFVVALFCSRTSSAIRSRNRESDRSAANVGRSIYCNKVDKSVEGWSITSRARGRRNSGEEVAASVAKVAQSLPAMMAGAGDISGYHATKQAVDLIEEKSWRFRSPLSSVCLADLSDYHQLDSSTRSSRLSLALKLSALVLRPLSVSSLYPLHSLLSRVSRNHITPSFRFL